MWQVFTPIVNKPFFWLTNALTIYSLLLVDDNPDELFLLTRALARGGLSDWSIQSLPNGKMALDYLRRVQSGELRLPTLLLLDVKMPGISGLHILDWVAKEIPQLPVLLFTSSESLADELQAKLLGARGYFLKSPTFSDFVEFLRTFQPSPVPLIPRSYDFAMLNSRRA